MSDSLKLCLPATIGVSRILSMSVYAPSRRMNTCAPLVSTDPAGVTAFCRARAAKMSAGEMPSVVKRGYENSTKIRSCCSPTTSTFLTPGTWKSLTKFFGDAGQFAQRHTRSFDRVESERDIRVFVVHERPDCALRQFARLISKFFSRLIELLGN